VNEVQKLLLLNELRNKNNKSDAEELLITYSEVIGVVSEILVSNSKEQISDSMALLKIKTLLTTVKEIK
jgi:hypothetical protein